MHSTNDDMFQVRPATLADIPQLVTLTSQPFTTGLLSGANLAFSQHEITSYLGWRLPRLLADPTILLLTLSFRPVNSFKPKEPSRPIGCAVVRLGSTAAASPSSKLSYADLIRSKARASLSDLIIWPDTSIAEVHTHIEAALASVSESVNDETPVVLFHNIDPNFQHVGLGNVLLAGVRDELKKLDQSRSPCMGIFQDVSADSEHIEGWQEVKGLPGGCLRIMKATIVA